MTDLKGKTVVITGATSGIGETTAIALARQGARVFAVGRDHARGAAVVKELTWVGGTGEFLSAAHARRKLQGTLPTLSGLFRIQHPGNPR